MPVEVVEGDCGCEAPIQGVIVEQLPEEGPCEVPVQECCQGQADFIDETVRFDGPAPVKQPSLLKRMRGWLHK